MPISYVPDHGTVLVGIVLDLCIWYIALLACFSNRNPDAHLRPQFRDIHLSLCQYDEHVLTIPNEAFSTHPQAGILGASLEAGQDMYIDLQTMYKS